MIRLRGRRFLTRKWERAIGGQYRYDGSGLKSFDVPLDMVWSRRDPPAPSQQFAPLCFHRDSAIRVFMQIAETVWVYVVMQIAETVVGVAPRPTISFTARDVLKRAPAIDPLRPSHSPTRRASPPGCI